VVEVAVPPEVVFAAFFARESLACWFGAGASITTARPLGIYAIEWLPSSESDPLLGPLGGTLYGIVIDVRPGREFFLGDAYWMPPEGDPIGPMALHVTGDPTATGTRVRVHQTGCDDSPRWQRYYRVMGAQWTEALERLKTLVER
jgi:uncharacterized protein YndB with AHSA1/START domain